MSYMSMPYGIIWSSNEWTHVDTGSYGVKQVYLNTYEKLATFFYNNRVIGMSYKENTFSWFSRKSSLIVFYTDDNNVSRIAYFKVKSVHLQDFINRYKLTPSTINEWIQRYRRQSPIFKRREQSENIDWKECGF